MWRRWRLALFNRTLNFLNDRAKPRVMKLIEYFIRYAWFLLLLVIVQAVISVFALKLTTSGSFQACLLEAAYTIMGEPPSILYSGDSVVRQYPLPALLILVFLRLSSWLLLPILLSLILEEVRKKIEKKYDEQEALRLKRARDTEQLLQQQNEMIKAGLSQLGFSNVNFPDNKPPS